MTEAASNTGPLERNARSPMQMGWRGYWDVVQRVVSRTMADRIGLIAAGIGFYALLALFPGITALVAVAGLALDPTIVLEELESASAALPEAARSILLDQVREVAGSAPDGLSLAALAGLGLAFFSASRGVNNLIAGLNACYDEEEKRGILRMIGLTLALTGFLIVILTVALAIVAFIPAALTLLGEQPYLQRIADILRWPLLLVVGAFTFTVLYRYGPSRREARWRWLAPGGLFGCLLWVVASFGFGWYVETLGTYNETFGALGGAIVLLLWLWISAFAVLLGAVIDAELEAQTAIDSTIGDPRPMGERGAVKADTFAGTP